jgi:hypothetical protein
MRNNPLVIMVHTLTNSTNSTETENKMNNTALIRMYNGVTYTVKEILNLWAGKTMHIPTTEMSRDYRGEYLAEVYKPMAIEEMVRITLKEGTFNPKDLKGRNMWGLSMELVSIPKEETTEEPATNETENEMNHLNKQEINNQLVKHINKAMVNESDMRNLVFQSFDSINVVKHNEGNLTQEVQVFGVWFTAKCKETNLIYEVHSNVYWLSRFYDPKYVSFSDLNEL